MSPEFTQGQIVLDSIKNLLEKNSKKYYVYVMSNQLRNGLTFSKAKSKGDELVRQAQ